MAVLQRRTAAPLLTYLPRWTLRLRLTLLYGVLFLLSGAALLAITYVLVDHATGDGVLVSSISGGSTTVMSSSGDGASGHPSVTSTHLASGRTGLVTSVGGGLTSAQIQQQTEQLQAQADRQHAAELHQLLVKSGVALGVMAVVSIVLGWIVAGKVLDPLRMITATTCAITATNLNERLRLAGPDDEVKELGDTIDGLLGRLESSFRSQRQFVANASHELRSPLARQRALIQVALADPDATVESLRAAHERVLVAEEQQERLLEALFTLTRGQAGPDRHELVDLAFVAEQALSAQQDDVRDRQLDVKISLLPAVVRGDPRLIERLVVNLVDNALRYNVDRGQVEVATETNGSEVILAISNTGPVIPQQTVDRLLQPFQRLGAERTQHSGGLGLGLSIVQAIAEAHSATLTVRANPDGGLHVEVRFFSRARPSTNPVIAD